MADEQARCCGQGGDSWAQAGSELKPACQLCPNSPTYWRRDGRKPLTAEESYAAVPNVDGRA